ncbi:MAG: ABC transporter substrate-binding protein, partial [Actinomycetia bacterium]|nr:ABC transporter substrate-binding protein [Actinomycetes bacterium]
MDRRSFLSKAGVGVAGIAASSAILAACSSSDDESTDGSGDSDSDPDSDSDSDSDEVTLTQGEPELEWEMGTSWPTALVTLFGAAQFFTEQVSRLTGGKFKINARPAGEIVGGLEVLPTVRDGGMEVGHTASYYYVGLSPVQQFGTAVPFGLTQRQQNAWLYQGGGLDLLNEFYAEEYGIIAFPAGGTGCQMGGWFTKEINTVADLQGLKMRIPGLAGQVLTNLGGEQITVAGGEILTSIETGAIDAAEFVGPTDDLILGLDQLGSQLFYYHPGWWEPGTAVEVQIPLALWNDLPPEFQAAVENAAAYANI